MFFKLKTTYINWTDRISAEALARLATHGIAISLIQGEQGELHRLIVNTESGEYVYLGEFNHQETPELVLINLLNDNAVEMCAPVRIVALLFLRMHAV